MQTCIVKRFITLSETGHFFIYESSLPENMAQKSCKNSDVKLRYDVLHSTWCFSKNQGSNLCIEKIFQLDFRNKRNTDDIIDKFLYNLKKKETVWVKKLKEKANSLHRDDYTHG